MRHRAMGVAALLALTGATADRAAAQAAAYPERPITIVAPSAPGGLFSLFARVIGNRLEKQIGATVVVENRPGATQTVGAQAVLRAPRDGYTLMIAASSTLVVNPMIHKKLPYDPAEFVPIALIARIPHVLVVNAGLPVHSIPDLVKLARSTPEGLSYGSAGTGNAQHLDGELLKSTLDIPLTHVPYKGMAPALTDVAGGHIPMMFAVIPPSLPLAQAGKIRMLAVTTTERIEPIPHVPTMAELGVQGFSAATWFALVAPRDTPQPVIDKLHAEMHTFARDPAAREELAKLGVIPAEWRQLDDLATFVTSETERFRKIVRQAGLEGSQ